MKHVILSLVAAGLFATAATAQDAADAPKKKMVPFAQADTDKDGFLTQAEWDASGRPAKRMAKADTDKDGKVSKAEMQAAAPKKKAQPNS